MRGEDAEARRQTRLDEGENSTANEAFDGELS